MALIPEVKCAKCDRKYSGLRTRCPFCGTTRYAKSAKAVPADNSTWKVVVGALLLVVLIAAVVVLVVTSVNENVVQPGSSGASGDASKSVTTVSSGEKEPATISPATTTEPGTTTTEPSTPSTTPGTTTEPSTPSTTPGTTTEPSTPSTTETTPKASVNSVVMVYGKNRVGVTNSAGQREFTLTKKEASIQLGVKVTPEGLDYTAIWESLNESVAIVNQSGKVTWVGTGSTTLRVTVDGISDEVIVRCSK